MKYKGGVRKKNVGKEGITPILDMIQNGTISLISNSSYFSIVFNIQVDQENSEYLDKDLMGNFSIPVTDYVLKLVLCTNIDFSYEYSLMGTIKSTETIQSVKKEADTQQKIWMKSVAGGRSPICPPIVDLIIIQENQETPFFNLLRSRFQERRKIFSNNVVDSLFNALKKLRGTAYTSIYLNAIVMPLRTRGDKPSTFYNILASPTLVPHFDYYMSDLLAKIIRLFEECSIIHLDLHSDNALACIDEYGLPYAAIIDFGMTSNIGNDSNDQYYISYKKKFLNDEKNNFINELNDIDIDAEDAVKIAYIKKVYNFLKDNTNTKKISPYFERRFTRQIEINAFDILKRSSSYNPEYLSTEEMNRMIDEGSLYNPNSTVNSKMITDTFIESHIVPEETGCTGPSCSIMGGKRRRKRKTRHTKKKKNRHTKRKY